MCLEKLLKPLVMFPVKRTVLFNEAKSYMEDFWKSDPLLQIKASQRFSHWLKEKFIALFSSIKCRRSLRILKTKRSFSVTLLWRVSEMISNHLSTTITLHISVLLLPVPASPSRASIWPTVRLMECSLSRKQITSVCQSDFRKKLLSVP